MCRACKYIVGLAFAAAMVGLIWDGPGLLSRVAYAAETAKADLAASQLKTTDKFSAPFEEAAAVIKPSLVSIGSTKSVQDESEALPQLPERFRQFFGDDSIERYFFHEQTPKHKHTERGLGSGVIVTADGYILTNAHVVDGSSQVQVTLSDDRVLQAKVVGTDSKTDLAVLKVNATGLYPAKLGDSDGVEVGQWVMAAGIPFGLSHTVTAGVVSAMGRSHVGITDYENFIQTDVPINPGNSGGPLLDLKGEVIGINTAIFSHTGGYMGIGFAIPANMAKSVMHSLITSGKVVRGYMGIGIQPLTEDLAKSFDYKDKQGALVGEVMPGSPAAKAGMKQGDIITEYDGKAVKGPDELREAVADTAPGSEAKIDVFRDGKEKALEVKVGELKNQFVSAEAAQSASQLGMTVKTLTPDMARELGTDHQEGVVVTEVDPAGLAAMAGIQANDLILSVQGTPVETATAFRQEVAKHDLKKGIRFVAQTDHAERFVVIRSSE